MHAMAKGDAMAMLKPFRLKKATHKAARQR